MHDRVAERCPWPGESGNLREESPLDSARPAYVAYLQESHLTFNQLVSDIAAVCACVFLQEFVA
jgi:hypothetical protein